MTIDPHTACEEAMQLYLEQVELQEKSKPLPKQESKAYTKIKVLQLTHTQPVRRQCSCGASGAAREEQASSKTGEQGLHQDQGQLQPHTLVHDDDDDDDVCVCVCVCVDQSISGATPYKIKQRSPLSAVPVHSRESL